MTVPGALTVLYRGPLASCNYDCPYCPFAKRRDPPALLRADAAALDRFTGWVAATTDVRLSILFTPWGEGLTRRWYREAIVRLSHLAHVERVAIQTNLAARPDWLAAADRDTAALWTTYHPGQVGRERFLGRARRLHELGVRFSVGVVGLPEHLGEARALRAALPAGVYLWVNAADGHRYDAAAERAWTAVDPLFGYSVRPHLSLGRECFTGEDAISVLGDGTVRRCHFVAEPLGNLYDGSWRAALKPRGCPNATCDCHIGYLHLKDLGLRDVFAGGLVERIPAFERGAASRGPAPGGAMECSPAAAPPSSAGPQERTEPRQGGCRRRGAELFPGGAQSTEPRKSTEPRQRGESLPAPVAKRTEGVQDLTVRYGR